MSRPTIRFCLKAEPNRHGNHVVRLRITSQRVSRFIATTVEIKPNQLNPRPSPENRNWIRSTPFKEEYNLALDVLWKRAVAVISDVDHTATAEQIKERILALISDEAPKPLVEPVDFIVYAESFIKRRGESGTTDTYKNAVGAFKKFCGKPSLMFDEITMLLLKEWRAWLQQKYTGNTPWLYHLRMKTIAFEAVEDLPDLPSTAFADAFRRVKIPKKRTVKQRLYPDEIERLANLDLMWNSSLRRTRDTSLLMYYAHGMRVGDALRLRASNYVIVTGPNGEEQHRLIYTMTKTKKPKNVLLPPVAVALLKPYREACTSPQDTLFPFLRRIIDAGYTEYRFSQKVIIAAVQMRVDLQRLAKKAKIDKPLSPHVFRHSFADFARRSGLPVTRIKDALGHDQLTTTQGYMEDLDQLSVDEVADLFD
ncbi:site-specific integrase [Spirosoma sp. SC4-14]|uniref:tyrosine-type recombinase/integrase n=1 Tax=Spirosoma sp. SC4-14 TaxID=3128900 RepID=UPI0030CC8725